MDNFGATTAAISSSQRRNPPINPVWIDPRPPSVQRKDAKSAAIYSGILAAVMLLVLIGLIVGFVFNEDENISSVLIMGTVAAGFMTIGLFVVSISSLYEMKKIKL